jgi:serine protease Do
MSRLIGVVIGLTGLVGFLVGLVVAGSRPAPVRGSANLQHPPSWPPVAVATPAPDRAPEIVPAPAVDFAAVAARLNQSVVNVDTASRGSARPRRSSRYSTDDPGAPREGSGSGFIIDSGGYVLTNQHVVAGADRVTVTLTDGRALRASVVGMDATLDVALLKVDAGTPLSAAPIGDSRSLRVGEWVCAIGNPLGVYVHSVTVGVVSFLGRKLFDEALDAYIQTDAAISVGNSGGPLINARGEVVGMTTAVSAQAASIGFAVPISEVMAILPQLRADGTVARGDLGASLTPVTEELRRALSLEPESGALVEDVDDDGSAARAGLRPYDVVVRADDRAVQNDDELVRYVASISPGKLSTLTIWRDGRSLQVPVKLGVRPVAVSARRLAEADVRPTAQEQEPLGLVVRDLDPVLAARLGVPPSVRGVLVTEVDPAGPARVAQIRINQVITEINRDTVRSVADFRRLVATLGDGDPVVLQVFDRATRRYVLSTIVSESLP